LTLSNQILTPSLHVPVALISAAFCRGFCFLKKVQTINTTKVIVMTIGGIISITGIIVHTNLWFYSYNGSYVKAKFNYP